MRWKMLNFESAMTNSYTFFGIFDVMMIFSVWQHDVISWTKKIKIHHSELLSRPMYAAGSLSLNQCTPQKGKRRHSFLSWHAGPPARRIATRACPAIQRGWGYSRDGTTEIWFVSLCLSSDPSSSLKGEAKFQIEVEHAGSPVLMDLVHGHICYRVLILLGFLAFYAQGTIKIFTLWELGNQLIAVWEMVAIWINI